MVVDFLQGEEKEREKIKYRCNDSKINRAYCAQKTSNSPSPNSCGSNSIFRVAKVT